MPSPDDFHSEEGEARLKALGSDKPALDALQAALDAYAEEPLQEQWDALQTAAEAVQKGVLPEQEHAPTADKVRQTLLAEAARQEATNKLQGAT